jgi:replication initiation protein RepC
MSAALVHGGLPAGVRLRDLVALVKQVAVIGVLDTESQLTRVSRTAVAVLEHFIDSCRETDFQKGNICGVWEQPMTIAAKLGISTKVLHNAEAELRKVKWIVRTSTPHARRSGERRGNAIVALAGISLAPLIDSYPELLQIRDAGALQQKAKSVGKAEIVQILRQIRELSDPEIIDQAEVILPGGRTSRINRIEKLQTIKADLEALLVCVDIPSGDTKTSLQTEEIVTPIIPRKDSIQNCSGRREPQIERDAFATLSPVTAAQLASQNYRALLDANGGPSWRNLVDTSASACNWLGIPERIWGDACQQMGRERAALCVLVIDRNCQLPEHHRYHRKHGRGSLMGMMRVGLDKLNLIGLMRAIEGYPEGTEGNVVPILQPAVQWHQKGVHEMGALVPGILAKFQSKQTEGEQC